MTSSALSCNYMSIVINFRETRYVEMLHLSYRACKWVTIHGETPRDLS